MKLSFIGVLVGLFFNLRLDQYFFSGPSGIHYIRQTDSLAFASQYFNTGNGFFNPSLFNFESIEGRAACEFPILYYISSGYYSLFGKNYYILKLLNLLIVYAGIYSVFNISYRILKDYFYAFMVALLVFTSTVFNYYSFNYLPDPGALGFTLIGWLFFVKYDSNKNNRTLLWSAFFFTLGSLIKITFLMNPLSVIVFYVGSLIFKKQKLNREIKSVLIYLSLGILAVIAWNLYILNYNSTYNSGYFTTGSRAIWSIFSSEISEVWKAISEYWYSSYFNYSSFYLIIVMVILQFIGFNTLKNKLFWISSILLSGSIAFFILFYSQFRHHDYYFITFFPAFLFIVINGIIVLQKITANNIFHLFIKVLFLIIILIGIDDSKRKLNGRLTANPDEISLTGITIEKELKEIEKLNIPKDAVFIVAPDHSKNGSLFFLNKRGWQFKTTEELTPRKVQDFNNLGGEYLLFVTDKKEPIEIGNNAGELIYNSEKIKIFNLTKT